MSDSTIDGNDVATKEKSSTNLQLNDFTKPLWFIFWLYSDSIHLTVGPLAAQQVQATFFFFTTSFFCGFSGLGRPSTNAL